MNLTNKTMSISTNLDTALNSFLYRLNASKIIIILTAFFLATSCTFYEPEFRGGENIKMGKLNGKTLKLTVDADIYNENSFALKVKPSTLDVYIEDQYMGKVHLDKKFKMKRKSTTRVSAPLTLTLADGAMFKLLALANKKNLKIRLSGKVKAGAFFISKKIDVNEEKTISGIKSKLGL